MKKSMSLFAAVLIPGVLAYAAHCHSIGRDDTTPYYDLAPLCTQSTYGSACSCYTISPPHRHCVSSSVAYSYCDQTGSYGNLCSRSDGTMQIYIRMCGYDDESGIATCEPASAIGSSLYNAPRIVPCQEGYSAELCPEPGSPN